MARRKVTVTMLDGTTHEATSEFMPLADRVAFERLFGVSTVVLTKHASLFDEGGNLKDGVDPSELADQREEYHAFLSWRFLVRGGVSRSDLGEFEEFVDNCATLNIGAPESGVDPTTVDPQPGN